MRFTRHLLLQILAFAGAKQEVNAAAVHVFARFTNNTLTSSSLSTTTSARADSIETKVSLSSIHSLAEFSSSGSNATTSPLILNAQVSGPTATSNGSFVSISADGPSASSSTALARPSSASTSKSPHPTTGPSTLSTPPSSYGSISATFETAPSASASTLFALQTLTVSFSSQGTVAESVARAFATSTTVILSDLHRSTSSQQGNASLALSTSTAANLPPSRSSSPPTLDHSAALASGSRGNGTSPSNAVDSKVVSNLTVAADSHTSSAGTTGSLNNLFSAIGGAASLSSAQVASATELVTSTYVSGTLTQTLIYSMAPSATAQANALNVLLSALPSSLASSFESQFQSATRELIGTKTAGSSTDPTGSESATPTSLRHLSSLTPTSSALTRSSITSSTLRTTPTSVLSLSFVSSSLQSPVSSVSSQFSITSSPTSSTLLTSTRSSSLSTSSSSSSTLSATPSASPSADSSGPASPQLKNASIAGIATGGAAGVVLVLLIALYIFRRRRQNKPIFGWKRGAQHSAGNRGIFPEVAWLYDPAPTPPSGEGERTPLHSRDASGSSLIPEPREGAVEMGDPEPPPSPEMRGVNQPLLAPTGIHSARPRDGSPGGSSRAASPAGSSRGNSPSGAGAGGRRSRGMSSTELGRPMTAIYEEQPRLSGEALLSPGKAANMQQRRSR